MPLIMGSRSMLERGADADRWREVRRVEILTLLFTMDGNPDLKQRVLSGSVHPPACRCRVHSVNTRRRHRVRRTARPGLEPSEDYCKASGWELSQPPGADLPCPDVQPAGFFTAPKKSNPFESRGHVGTEQPVAMTTYFW